MHNTAGQGKVIFQLNFPNHAYVLLVSQCLISIYTYIYSSTMYCDIGWSYFASGALLSCGIITSGGSGGVDRLVMFNGSQSSVPSTLQAKPIIAGL